MSDDTYNKQRTLYAHGLADCPAREIVLQSAMNKFEGAIGELPAENRTTQCFIYNAPSNPTAPLGISHGTCIGDDGPYLRALKTNTPFKALFLVKPEGNKGNQYFETYMDATGTVLPRNILKAAPMKPPTSAIWKLGPKEGRPDGYAVWANAQKLYLPP